MLSVRALVRALVRAAGASAPSLGTEGSGTEGSIAAGERDGFPVLDQNSSIQFVPVMKRALKSGCDGRLQNTRREGPRSAEHGSWRHCDGILSWDSPALSTLPRVSKQPLNATGQIGISGIAKARLLGWRREKQGEQHQAIVAQFLTICIPLHNQQPALTAVSLALATTTTTPLFFSLNRIIPKLPFPQRHRKHEVCLHVSTLKFGRKTMS